MTTWDPFAEPSYDSLIEEPIPHSREVRVLRLYIVNIPQWFFEQYQCTKQLLAPPGFEYDGRSSPPVIDRVLPRWSLGTPADFIHDNLYRATRTLNWLVEQKKDYDIGSSISTELSEYIAHYRLVLRMWSRKAADDFYFEHKKAIAQHHNLPRIAGHPVRTRVGQFIGRSKSWAGVRVGAWWAWQANPNLGYGESYEYAVKKFHER